MLSIEEIKKIFDSFEVEGFRATSGLGLYIPSDLNSFKETYIYYSEFASSITYHLFLQRVIEGINKEYDDESLIVEYNSYQGGYQFTHLEHETCEHKHSKIFESIDQAKEESIKYVLGKL